MVTTEISQSLIALGYPLMLLLMIVEGPIVTLIAAFLASLGIFNIFFVFCLSITGDVLGDLILYLLGKIGGRRTLIKAEKILNIKQSVVEKLERKFEKNGAKIIFAVKSTTGLCWITFILAGAVKMNMKNFLRYSLLGGLVWSSFLVVLGYFFGYAAEKINVYIQNASYYVLIAVLIFFLILNIYRKIQTKNFIKK